jgi:release factor glutamine methyltransferase
LRERTLTSAVDTRGLAALAATTTRERGRRTLFDAFRAAGLPNPSLDARVLTCAALGIDHAALVRDPDGELGDSAAILRDVAERRLRREPVSRITGSREFYDSRLEIDPHVLDPRPDTETLVEAVLDRLAPRRGERLRILDLGVGSGAILCSLLRGLPNAFGIGVDISAGACAVARRNLIGTGVATRGAILRGLWTDALRGRFDVVASNPPYISTERIAMLDEEVHRYDPRLALDGGTDGLDAYRAIAPRLALCIAEGGLVALEIDQDRFREVAAILDSAGLEPTARLLDLARHDRVVLAQVKADPDREMRQMGAT